MAHGVPAPYMYVHLTNCTAAEQQAGCKFHALVQALGL